MTHRERVFRALEHWEPDRVPIDMGGTIVTGITALAYRDLKAHLGIDDRPIRLADCAQQLAWVDDKLLEHFDAKVLPLYRLVDGFGIRLDAWQEGALTEGTRALVPAGFNPVWEGGAYRIKRGGNVDVIQFGDDFGMQNGLQILPSLYRELFKLRQKRMWEFVKKRSDYKIFLHSCGAISEILPDLIDIRTGDNKSSTDIGEKYGA